MVWQVLSRFLLGGVLVASAGAYEAVPVLICGIIVGGSALPITLKAFRRRVLRKAEIEAGDLEGLLERRLAEFEDRSFQYLNELEDRNAERIEAVEERIDYTERLLARRNEAYVPEEKPFRGLPMVTPI
jgi:hypothetical protein